MNYKKQGNFFMIDNDYVKLYAKHLGVVATAVFTSLNMHADAEGKCFPSMELIAEQHGIDRHTVSKALKKLEEWNMIRVDREYNRKLKRRKNNTYELLPIELWRKPPVEEEVIDNIDDGIETTTEDDDDPLSEYVNRYDSKKSHGIQDATYMASKIPDDGVEDASNKTHITTTIEEYSFCGQEPTKTYKENTSLIASSNEPAVWSSDKAVLALIKNSCKDYQIIGTYFYMQQYSFSDELVFDETLKRSLRAAKALKGYKIDDIIKTMQWMNDREFEMGWSLEAVQKYVDVFASMDFIPEV